MSNEAFEKWFVVSKYNDEYYQIAKEAWQAAKADSEQEISELKSHINDLREALDEMVAMEELEGNSCEPQRQLLASTPAQSLQAHDNEVIERCAKVCDESYAFDSDGFAKEIRALKT